MGRRLSLPMLVVLAAVALQLMGVAPALAQTAVPAVPPAAAGPAVGQGSVLLQALLTDDGQPIDQGLVWRVFAGKVEPGARPKLLATFREPSPTLRMPAGDYVVNVAFGRANLTRRVSLKSGEGPSERFVLNAGGLRVVADVGGRPPPANTVTFQILADDAAGNRSSIITGVKPGLVVRLNAGIYQVVSTYGDANATVRADVTVEAGKLTEAAISHQAARVAFKLVAQTGGDAVPDTQWSIQTMTGEIVKESVGAIPTHTLAPGTYAAIAKRGGRSWRRDFLIRHGETVQVEVVMQ